MYGDPQPDQHQHRLVWCPFVHEEDTTDSLIVAISNGSRVSVFIKSSVLRLWASRKSVHACIYMYYRGMVNNKIVQ